MISTLISKHSSCDELPQNGMKLTSVAEDLFAANLLNLNARINISTAIAYDPKFLSFSINGHKN